jgi:hypothetical protein
VKKGKRLKYELFIRNISGAEMIMLEIASMHMVIESSDSVALRNVKKKDKMLAEHVGMQTESNTNIKPITYQRQQWRDVHGR